MAEITAFPKSGADILGGLAKGTQIAGGIQNIQASRANVQLQQQAAQRQADQQQFAQEQQQQQEEHRNLDLQLDRNDKIIGSLIDSGILETNPDAIRPYIDASRNLGVQRYGENAPAFDADLIIQNANEYKKIHKTAQALEKAGDVEGAQNYLAENAHMFIRRPKAEQQLVAGEQERFGADISQKEKIASIAEATKGLDPQVQSIVGLAAEGAISPVIAQQLLKGSGVNIKSGIAGTGGGSVTAIFDDTGKIIAEIPEQPKATTAKETEVKLYPTGEINELTGEPVKRPMILGRAANGEFVLTPVRIAGQQEEGLAPQEQFGPQGSELTQQAQKATPEQTKSAIAEAKRETKGQAPSRQQDGQVGTRESFIASAIKLNEEAIASGEITKEEIGDLFDSRNAIGGMTLKQFSARMKLDKPFLRRTIEQWKRLNKGKPVPILTSEKSVRKFYNDFKKIGE